MESAWYTENEWLQFQMDWITLNILEELVIAISGRKTPQEIEHAPMRGF